MRTKEILEEIRKLKELAWLNKANEFNKNNEKTKQDIEDYLNKEWKDISIS